MVHSTIYTRLYTYFRWRFSLFAHCWHCDRCVSACLSRLEYENNGVLSPHTSFTISMHWSPIRNRKHKGPQKTVVFLRKVAGVCPMFPACRNKNFEEGVIIIMWFHIQMCQYMKIQTNSVVLTCKIRFKCNQMLLARPKSFYFLFS